MRLRAKFGFFALGLSAAASVVALIGIVRLAHQFPAAASSPGLLAPFLLPVLALALEAGALVALSVALLRALVQTPAAAALGRARATSMLLVLLAGSVALAELIPRGTEHPGAFANQLVQSARDSCGESGKVPVPLLGLSVSCATPQRIEGPMPGAAAVQLSMGQLTFSDDLRKVEISALDLSANSSLRVRLRAGSARVSGLAPWSRSPRLSSLGRFAMLAALGVVLWLGASVLLRPRQTRADEPAPGVASGRVRRGLGYLLFASPGAVIAAVVISLDQARAAPLTYASAGVLGVLALGLVALLLARFPRICSSFQAF
jgi:hypothetical protein